ncbi:hypothetical protein HanXRQr2_Chr17g0795201 [Helianthus annuus]|uniref:Uncharacterized protein n=1 Tax=Helianthus annuus TaxID=4232 RepID=A0A9K3DHJ3_HELAN|nr:hypothetical protein HanXRQr2_Chr17g0795201 [Helianthus annuus]KAJ0812540.1 hypothetical protein HanPSC8_Chr17g0763121 [Helianthus annuus]
MSMWYQLPIPYRYRPVPIPYRLYSVSVSLLRFTIFSGSGFSGLLPVFFDNTELVPISHLFLFPTHNSSRVVNFNLELECKSSHYQSKSNSKFS